MIRRESRTPGDPVGGAASGPAPDDLLALAHVLRPHGIRGELSAKVLAPPVLEPLELLTERRLFARSPNGKVEVVQGEGARPHQDRWLVRLAGVETMNDAEEYRGWDLCLPRNELPELPEGWFWEADLEGCRVVDSQLGEIGRVSRLETRGPQPQLILHTTRGVEVTIPWVSGLVPRVDLEGRSVHTDLPEEYPGLERPPDA